MLRLTWDQTFLAHTDVVDRAIAKAREAQLDWAKTSFVERRKVLQSMLKSVGISGSAFLHPFNTPIGTSWITRRTSLLLPVLTQARRGSILRSVKS